MQRHKKKPEIGRRYFHGTLSEMIMGFHMKPMSVAEQNRGGVLFGVCRPLIAVLLELPSAWFHDLLELFGSVNGCP